MRRTAAAVVLSTAALALSACGGGGDDDGPRTQPSSGPSSGPSCSGGEVRFLQGQPADLPGGGSGGIGQVRTTDPPTVDLALGGDDVRAGRALGVGDTFGVAGTTYRITCISASVVTADRAG